MSNRTTTAKVEEILAENMICGANLTPYIRAANLLVSRVAQCAIDKSHTLSTAELTEIETWLAAYYYTHRDPLYKSKSTDGASGSFDTDPKKRRYLSVAIDLDTSGCLNALMNRQSASAVWVGKTPSERIPYDQRD